MARKSRVDELREKFEAAIVKGLESDSAGERTAALKAAADLFNPNLGELQKQVKQAEDRAAKAEASLAAVVSARDQAQAILVIACQSALQGTSAKAELAALRATNDEWKAEQTKLIVAEAQQCKWDAQRAERAGKEVMEAARQEFTKKGYDALLDAMRDLVAANNIPQIDIWNLPKNVNPLFLTLWQGWTPIKAQLFVAFTQSYPEANEGFVQAFARCLIARLPIQGNITPDPVENRDVKIEVLTLMASRWPGVLEQVQKRVDETQINRQTTFLRNHYADMAAAQSESARRGEGRSPIGEPEPESSIPVSEHLEGCVCKICSPNLRRLGSLDALDNVENF